MTPVRQYVVYGGPTGVIAAAGAVLAWPVRRWTGQRMIHGLALAAVIIGVLITVVVAVGLLMAATSDSRF